MRKVVALLAAADGVRKASWHEASNSRSEANFKHAESASMLRAVIFR